MKDYITKNRDCIIGFGFLIGILITLLVMYLKSTGAI